MQRAIPVPHHRKLFWIAAGTGITGLLLLLAVRLTALGGGALSELPVPAGAYVTPVGETVGLSLLGVAAACFVWAWHLMSKSRVRRG